MRRRIGEIHRWRRPAGLAPGRWTSSHESLVGWAHVTSEHFKQAQADLPQDVQETPHIRNVVMEGDHWDRLGEFEVG